MYPRSVSQWLSYAAARQAYESPIQNFHPGDSINQYMLKKVRMTLGVIVGIIDRTYH